MARRPCSALLLVALVTLATPARAVITDTGSVEVTPDGRLVIGAAAFGSRVVDGEDDGPYVSAELGLESGGKAELLLENGARLTTTGEMEIGKTGSAVVEVSTGSELSTGGALVSRESSRGYNIEPYRVLVTGEGSSWVNNGYLEVGRVDFSTDTRVIVEHGGRISTHGALFAGQWAGDGNTDLIIDGVGSRWENSGVLQLNPAAELYIRNGGEAIDNGVYIGGSYYRNRAVVEGAGSLWQTGDMQIWGAQNPLVIRDGGRVESGSVYMTTQTSQRMLVQGAGSAWIVSGRLSAVSNDAGGNAFVTVEDGALLDTGEAWIGINPGGYDGIDVQGAGSVWTNRGHMRIEGGRHLWPEINVLAGARAESATVSLLCDASQGRPSRCGIQVGGADSRLEISDSATMTGIGGAPGDGGYWRISNGGRTEVGNTLEAIGTSRIELAQGSLAANQLLLTGAALTGSGLVEADVVNRGDVAPGQRIGAIEIVGDYHQETDGTLSIELDGRIAGEEHDFLSVFGTSFLGGRLAVALGDGFLPQVGDVFHILESTAIAGEFDSFQGLQLTPTRRLAVEYLPTGVQLVTVPEPGTGLLLAAGVSLLAGIRRRSAGPRP